MQHMKKSDESSHILPDASIEDVRQICASAGMPPDVQEKADSALEALEALTAVNRGSAEQGRKLAYVRHLADLPWNRTSKIKPDIHNVRKTLSQGLHAKPGVRDKILEHLTLNLLNEYETPRILVVDDEKIALESMAHILKKEDYAVVTAGSGTEAINKLNESHFDVVITDLIMGEVDGTTVIKESINKHPGTQVIMITGYATVDTAVEALRMGAFHYIEKPINIDELRSSVKEALHHNNPGGHSHALCFEGPEGEELISIGKLIAEALGRKCLRIPLQEIRSRDDIFGQSPTNSDAVPGRIIDEIRRAGTADPVIILDGIDMAGQYLTGDYASCLIDLIDPAKNCRFTDRYLDVPFDLSDVLFILAIKSADSMQSPLKDLLCVIKL